MNTFSVTGAGQFPVMVGKHINSQYFMYMNPNSLEIIWSIITPNGQAWITVTPSATLNKWQYYTGTYNSSANSIYTYVNGVQVYKGTLSGNMSFNNANGDLFIGMSSNASYSIANVQIYNASLTANDVRSLYNEGIGGVPTDLQHLIGWWPLNGNAEDYSGNNNDGVPYNVRYSATWQDEHVSP